MVQRTVLKVDISCEKCKKKVLKAVSGLQGVDKIELDGAKGTVTITGNADPLEIITRTRKTGKLIEVVSIGPPPAPPKQDGGGGQKKPEEKKPEQDKKQQTDQKAQAQFLPPLHVPPYCPVCDHMRTHMETYDAPASCSIL
ncbi:hypothetical protein ACLOJK_001829 [Asimina triloba]